MKNKLMDKKGFTLMELLVAIGIMALIAAIAIPVCSGILEKSKVQSDEITATTYSTAMQFAWNADSDIFTRTLTIDENTNSLDVYDVIEEVKTTISKQNRGSTFDPLTDDYHYFYSTWANKVVVADKDASILELNELAGNYDLAGNKLEANAIWFDLTANNIK